MNEHDESLSGLEYQMTHLEAAFHETQEVQINRINLFETALKENLQTVKSAVTHEFEVGKLQFEILRREMEVQMTQKLSQEGHQLKREMLSIAQAQHADDIPHNIAWIELQRAKDEAKSEIRAEGRKALESLLEEFGAKTNFPEPEINSIRNDLIMMKNGLRDWHGKLEKIPLLEQAQMRLRKETQECIHVLMRKLGELELEEKRGAHNVSVLKNQCGEIFSRILSVEKCVLTPASASGGPATTPTWRSMPLEGREAAAVQPLEPLQGMRGRAPPQSSGVLAGPACASTQPRFSREIGFDSVNTSFAEGSGWNRDGAAPTSGGGVHPCRKSKNPQFSTRY